MKNILLFISFIFIFFSCVKTKGDVSMTYEKATAVYGDLDAIRALPLIKVQQQLKNPGKIYVGNDYILVGEEGEGIHIFDNSNMTNPIRLSFIQIPFNKEFFVKDNVIYAESLYDFLKIDITNVYQPQLISRAKEVFGTPYQNDKGESLISFDYIVTTDVFELNSPKAQELKKEGKLHLDYLDDVIPTSTIPSSFTSSSSGVGTLNRIAVEFNHIYVLGGNSLHVISNNGNLISYEDDIKLDDGMETIYAKNNRLYIGSEDAMLTYSVSNPSRPSKVSEFSHTTACDPVLPNGDVAYMTLRSVENAGCNVSSENSLNIIDISNEQEPESINSIEMESPCGMTMINQRLFVGEGENGLAVFNTADPRDLVEVARITGIEAYDVMRHPTNPNVLLTTGSNGLQQFQIDYNTYVLTPLSVVNY